MLNHIAHNNMLRVIFSKLTNEWSFKKYRGTLISSEQGPPEYGPLYSWLAESHVSATLNPKKKTKNQPEPLRGGFLIT